MARKAVCAGARAESWALCIPSALVDTEYNIQFALVSPAVASNSVDPSWAEQLHSTS